MGFWEAVASAGPYANNPPRSRQITTPTPHYSFFAGRMLFSTPNRQVSEHWRHVVYVCRKCLKFQNLKHYAVDGFSIWSFLFCVFPLWSSHGCNIWIFSPLCTVWWLVGWVFFSRCYCCCCYASCGPLEHYVVRLSARLCVRACLCRGILWLSRMAVYPSVLD